jgi:hypothetical protein
MQLFIIQDLLLEVIHMQKVHTPKLSDREHTLKANALKLKLIILMHKIFILLLREPLKLQ